MASFICAMAWKIHFVELGVVFCKIVTFENFSKKKVKNKFITSMRLHIMYMLLCGLVMSTAQHTLPRAAAQCSVVIFLKDLAAYRSAPRTNYEKFTFKF